MSIDHQYFMIMMKMITCIYTYTVMVTVQKENSWPWIYGIATNHGYNEYNGCSYKIHIMKIGRIVIRTTRYMKLTQYCQNST